MSGSDFTEERRLRAASGGHIPAAWMEVATGRRGCRIGHVTFEHDSFSMPAGSDGRHGGEECLGIRMKWIAEKIFRRTFFNNPAEVHDTDFIADMPYDIEVMGYEHVCKIEIRLELKEKIYDLGLYRNIESADWFIRDNKLRFADQGPRYGYSLPLPA